MDGASREGHVLRAVPSLSITASLRSEVGDCRAFLLDPVDEGARPARPAQASAVVRLLKVVSTNHSQLARCATAIIALMREYWRFETA